MEKIAVVTESGNGLGKSFSQILLNHNYKVILAADLKSYNAINLEDSISKGIDLVATDFKSDDSLSELKSHINDHFDHLDLLVNNAEIANGFGQKIDQINIDEVRDLYEVNLFSIMRIIQLLKPLLEKSEKPGIVNITSAMGDVNKMKDDEFCYTDYCMTGYATSKAALNMYTHLQCKEFKTSKITVTSFDPISPNNCTYNSVRITEAIESQFISLIEK